MESKKERSLKVTNKGKIKNEGKEGIFKRGVGFIVHWFDRSNRDSLTFKIYTEGYEE